MKLLRLIAFVGVVGFAVPASADLNLTFTDGRVTLEATNAPLRQILAEWARRGQTRIVGLEKVNGAPVTLRLTNEPEKKALEILLRSLAGYMAAPRVAAVAGASVYDRIMLLPTSVAAAAPAGPRPAAFQPPPPQPVFPDPIANANQEAAPEDASDDPFEVPVFNPNVDPANQAAPAPSNAPAAMPPQSAPVGPNPIRPYQTPNDVNAPPPAQENEAGQVDPTPLTSPRPGVLPLPQQQPRP